MIFFNYIGNIIFIYVTVTTKRYIEEVMAYGKGYMKVIRAYDPCVRKGICMKRRNRSGFKNTPFVALTWELLNSKAYKQLPSSAAKILPHFLGKAKIDFRDPARYETQFTFPYSEAHRYGFAKSTFSKALRDLMRFGFIDPVSKGGLRGTGLTSSMFKLSKRWADYDTTRFREIKWECFYKEQRQVQELKRITPEHETKPVLGEKSFQLLGLYGDN